VLVTMQAVALVALVVSVAQLLQQAVADHSNQP
jgi:hypothetical protein